MHERNIFFFLSFPIFFFSFFFPYLQPNTPLVVHYSFGFTAYKAANGGVFFDVGLLGPCGKHAEDAEDVASMPRTLQSMPRTLPSMPRSCQVSLHILGSHMYLWEIVKYFFVYYIFSVSLFLFVIVLY